MIGTDSESEDDTLSLSFLDCVSCGLGAAMILFVLFGILLDAPSRSTKTSSRVTGQIGALSAPSSPVDIEIRFTSPVAAPTATWLRLSQDDQILRPVPVDGACAATDCGIAFFRHLKRGFGTQQGWRSSENQTGFEVVGNAPQGMIIVHQAGRSVPTPFRCEASADPAHYRVLGSIDRRSLTPVAACSRL